MSGTAPSGAVIPVSNAWRFAISSWMHIRMAISRATFLTNEVRLNPAIPVTSAMASRLTLSCRGDAVFMPVPALEHHHLKLPGLRDPLGRQRRSVFTENLSE